MHQRLDALVHITEPLLQPHDMFAIGGETKMPRLDNAGVHGADRNLVQALTLSGKEHVRRRFLRGLLPAERMRNIPEPEIKPRPRVGRAICLRPNKLPMARSRRMAGACLAPTLGYFPSLQW